MAYAQLDRNSALGAAAEKRRRKEEVDNTAIIDRNSAMGQYLVSTAEDTVNSITKSIQDNASVYDSLQKRFSNFTDENKRYVPAEQAQKFSENFATQRELLEKQKKQLSRLGLGDSALYDTIASQSSWFENNRLWLNNRLKYSSQFKDAKDENKSYYGWLNDDAVTNSETAAERAKIYDENAARIAEIEKEMGKYGRQWNGTSGVPVYTGWGDKAKYKKLKAEKERLEAENRQYDRTQGRTDSYFKVTQTPEYKKTDYAESLSSTKGDMSDELGVFLNADKWKPISGSKNESALEVDDELPNADEVKYYGIINAGRQNAWEQLTRDEVRIYYTIRSNEGDAAANKYLEQMGPILVKRANNDFAKWLQDRSTGEMALYNAASIPMQVIGNISSFADTVSQRITGKEYNPYSYGNRIQSEAGIIRGVTANNLDDTTNNFSLLGLSAGNVYQMLMSGADSIAGKLFPPYLIQSGMGALTSTARDLYDEGASGADILGVSTAAGFFEMFFEKFSVDKFTDVILGKPTKTVADIIKKALIQGGTEASEEFCTELANMATEALILGDRQRVNDDISKYMQQGDSENMATAKAWAMNLYNAAMGGFISGGAIGGLAATGQYAYHKMSEVPATGKAIIENGGVEKLADTAYRYSGNAQLRDEINRVDGEKVGRSNRILADAANEALKNRTERNVGKLADMVTAVEEKAEKARVKQSAADLVKDAGLKGVNAFAVKRALTSENNGRLSQQIINNSEVFEKAAAAREAKLKAEKAKQNAEIESAKSRVEEKAKVAEKAIRSGDTAELVKNDAAGVRSDGMEITLGAITSAENGQISVEFDPDTHQSAVFSSSEENAPVVDTDNGATQAQVQTVKANNPEVNALYSSLSSAVSGTIAADTHTDATGRSFSTGTKMSVDAANVVLGLYNEKLNPSAEEYVRFMYESYKAGKNGLSFERLKDSLANKNYGFYEYEGGVTETQLKQAYISGVKEMKAIKGVTRIGVKNITDGKHKNALTQLSALDQYARKHGISIICVDALYDETGTPINGEYRSGNNIVISLDADGGLYMPVVGHELFHYIESINAEDARVLTNMVINTLKGVKGEEWLSQRRKEYEGYGYKGEEIDSEIAADFFGAAVTEKEFERQVKSAELNKSFTQKVIDKVKEIVAELKEIMQNLRGQRLIYDAALDMDTEMLDFFVDNFERILDQAKTETSTETKNTAENSGVKKQAKIGKTEDGRGIYKTNYAKNTPKSVKQQDIIDIVQNVWSKKPISLYITEGNTSRRITANFDPTLSERSDLAKIVYGNRKGTASEKRMTLDLSSDFYQIATESKNTGNLSEKGKTNPAHNGVTDWHYFVTNLVYEDADGNRMDCHMNIDVKENPSGNFFYSFSIEKGTAPQTLLAVVADEESTTVPNSSISDLSEKSNPQNMTSEKKFQRKLPDIRSKLESMSKNQTVADAVEDAKTLVEDVLEYARSEIGKAKLNMTETGGVLPQRSKIEKIVKKFNRNGEFSEIKNAALTDDIMAIMTDYMNGVGSSDTLLNLLSDTLYNAKLNTYDVLGTETFDDIKEYTSGGRFYVSDEVASQLKDNGYDIRKANAILSHAYGFTISGEKTGIAHKRTPWATTGAEIAGNAAYLYDGTDYSENAREGAEYETIMALIDIAENHPPVYHYYWQHELNGAKTYEERFVVQDRLADEVNEEALDIFGEIMAASPLVTKADRYRSMIDRFAEKNAAQKAKYEADLAKEKTRVEQIRAENREKMKDLRDQKNSKIQDSVNEVRQVYRERMKQQRTDMENTAARAKQRTAIARKVKNLTNLLVNESDQKHIPQGMKNIVSEFLLPFTENSSVFGTGGDNGLNAERYMRFHDMLTDIYRATEGDADDTGALNAEYRNLAGNIDGDLLRDLESMRGTMLGKRLSALTAEELSVIDKIISNISGLVKQGNKMAVQNRTTTVSELGNKAIAELKDRKQRKKRKSPVDFAIDLAVDEMATPIYFFNQKLGGPFRELYDDFRDGQDSWYIKCDEARSRIAGLQKQYNYNKWSEEVYSFELSSGEKINLTTEALLSLYATAKREQMNGMDTEHLLSGGITLAADIEETARKAALKAEKGKTDKKQTEQYIRSEAKHITVTELYEMLLKLTDEQKSYADGLVDFLSTTVGGWGNDTSMTLFNYKKFNEAYYFPITSDKNYLYTRFAVSDDTRLKHTGFTHKITHGANNPIVISGFTETAARHINQMALYSSFAVPIENMTRVYNYEEAAGIDADGHKVRGMSVKNAVTNAYGKSANAYIADFMRAVNGGIKADSLESKLDIGTKYFKRNAVLGNLSVAIQQPSAIMRAQAVMNGRYFMGVRLLDGEGLISTDEDGKRNTAYTRARDEMYKYSAVAGIKKLGGFDVGIGTSVTDWMTGAKQGFFDKASEKLGILAEKADEATWTNIWLAKKREINKRIELNNLNLEIGSQEYFSLVAKEFRDVIDFTQVYDSVLSKSQLMRSKSRFVRSVMAFMAEPTLSYNLVLNAFRSNSTISRGKSIAAFASAVILNTLLQSLVAAWRDKDDESYWERYIKSVTSSLIGTKSTGFFLGSEFNVFNNLPIIKDALSLLQGYDINRSDTEILSEVADLYDKIKKTAQNAEKLSEKKSDKYTGLNHFQEQLFGNIFDAVIMLSNLSPIPLKSVAKEVKGLENAILHATRDDMKFKTTSYTAWDAFLEGIGFEQDKPLKAYLAVKNNEQEVLRRMKSSDSWETWVRKGLKEYDKGSDLDKKAINRIEEAATANYSGDYETYERLVAEIEKEGFAKNDILAAVEGLVGKMRPKEEAKEPSDKHLYTTKMLEDAIRQDNAEAVEDIKEKLKEVEKKTDENIKSAIKSIAKNYYEDGDHTAAEKILRNYAEFTTDEVKEALAWFNFSELNPDSDLPYMSWQSWRNKAASGQVNGGKGKITASQYEAYYKAVKGLTGDDLDGDGKADSGTKKKKVLAAINKLPLTSDQKDTLFYLNGYGKSTIGDAPWH